MCQLSKWPYSGMSLSCYFECVTRNHRFLICDLLLVCRNPIRFNKLVNFAKYYPVDIYLLKVNNRNSRKSYEICSELTIKTPERRQWRLGYVKTWVWNVISRISYIPARSGTWFTSNIALELTFLWSHENHFTVLNWNVTLIN